MHFGKNVNGRIKEIGNHVTTESGTTSKPTAAHEYLDVRWRQLQRLLHGGETVFGSLVAAAKDIIRQAHIARESSKDES